MQTREEDCQASACRRGRAGDDDLAALLESESYQIGPTMDFDHVADLHFSDMPRVLRRNVESASSTIGRRAVAPKGWPCMP